MTRFWRLETRWGAWVLAALCAAAAWWCAWRGLASFGAGGHGLAQALDRGEALWHGLPSLTYPNVTWSMPGDPLFAAALLRHSPAWAASAALVALCLAYFGLVFCLGRSLHSSLCGLAAAALCLPLLPSVFWEEQGLYCACVLLAAVLAVSRLDSPGRTILAGAAVGLGLLVRSPLFLFPVLLCLVVWRREKASAPKDKLHLLSPLLLIPAAVLLPWVWANWKLFGVFSPFEHGRADSNLVAGALGLSSTMEGDFRRLAGLGHGAGALGWAAGEILSHPLRSTAAWLARLRLVFGMHPWLCAAAALGAWLGRRRPGMRVLALLAGYFAAIHCLMAVEPRYFQPLWPLLAALAVCGPVAALLPPPDGGPRSGGLFVRACLVTLAAWSALVLAKVARYPLAAARGTAGLERALAAAPDDPWLLSQRGRLRLAQGRAAEAAEDLGRAFALDPQPEARLDYAWALLISGGPAARLLEAPLEGSPWTVARGLTLRGAAALAAGDPASAGRLFDESFGLWQDSYCRLRGIADRGALGVQERLRAVDATWFEAMLAPVLASWPAQAREPRLERLAKALGGGRSAMEKRQLAALWLGLAKDRLAAGQRPQARKAVDRAMGWSQDPEVLAAAEGLYREAGDETSSSRVLESLASSRPGDPEVRLELAASALGAGRIDEAQSSAERAAQLAGSSKARLRAQELLGRVCAMRASAALAAARRGEKALALREMDRALAGPRSARELEAGAGLYRSFGEREKEFRALSDLVEERPRDAASRAALAEAAVALDRAPAAEAALERFAHRTRDAALLVRAGRAYHRLSRPCAEAEALAAADESSAPDASVLGELAAAAAKCGRRSAARRALEKGRRAASRPEQLGFMAQVYEDLGEKREALSLRRAAAELSPRQALGWIELARAGRRLSDPGLAALGLGRARACAQNAADLERLALVEEEGGDLAAAVSSWGKRISRFGADAGALSGRALTRRLAGDRAGALADLRRAVSLDPRHIASAMSLVSLLKESGENKEARRVCSRALAGGAQGRTAALLAEECRALLR